MKPILVFMLSVVLTSAFSNNVRVTNVSTITTTTYTQVEFDLSWDNSWRISAGPSNWDAVWVIIKYKTGGQWRHLNLTGLNNAIGAGYTLTVPSDLKGAFIYRSADGTGNVTLTDLRLGVQVIPGSFDIKMIGIEMVQVPGGDFYIGDGDGTLESTNSFHLGVNNGYVPITSALRNNIRTDVNAYDDTQLEGISIGIDGDGGLDSNGDNIIDNPDFPTGYQSFYCMKYEISQGAYRDFLNTLSYTQQVFAISPDVPPPNSAIGTMAFQYGPSIEIATPGVAISVPAVFGTDADADNIFDETTDGEWQVMNELSWQTLCAYLDWAALRPMTELEFEKACRGPGLPIYGEYAWGNTNIFSTNYTLSNLGLSSEAPSNASAVLGNALYSQTWALYGPYTMIRNGGFANATTGRTQSGSAFYGAMEMSGTVWERAVTVGNVEGRSYTGIPGNGELNSAGNADVNFWPGSGAGSGFRGGSFFNSANILSVSNRFLGAGSTPLAGDEFGGRGVR